MDKGLADLLYAQYQLNEIAIRLAKDNVVTKKDYIPKSVVDREYIKKDVVREAIENNWYRNGGMIVKEDLLKELGLLGE